MKRIALLLLCAMLLGCAAPAGNAAEFVPPESERLTLYTSHKPEVYEPIVREFEERTGIWVTVETGGTNELLERIALGDASGAGDVMFGGGVESLLAAADCFEAYESAESAAVAEPYRSADARIVPFSALPLVLIYNTRLVEPEQITDWSALLDPAWKGRIAFADPGVSGSSYTALCTLCQEVGGDPYAVLEAFADNLDGKQLSSSGDVLDAVADGQLWIGVTLEETALKYIHGGYNLALVYPDGGTSAVPDGCAILKNAPHAENAQRFIDFILGADVQQTLTNELYRRSVRSDVQRSPALPSAEVLGIIPYDYDWSIAAHDDLLRVWKMRTEGAQ